MGTTGPCRRCSRSRQPRGSHSICPRKAALGKKVTGVQLHLITAEDPLTLAARSRELIRFPQLTMPLLAALTPPEWTVTHSDEITRPVTYGRYDVVGLTAATPGAPR